MPNWGQVLKEIKKTKDEPAGGDSAADKIRKKYLMELNAHHGRNVICYYSGFLSKSAKIEGLDINDEDKNGFMLCIHGMDRKKGLDIFLHTPGGSGAATESLIFYLKEMFGKDIRAFVPQIAMSAGTIIACACREIFMGKHSSLGPVDPQIRGIPAYAVVAEIERAYKEIARDKLRAYVWNAVLSRYTPGFAEQCQWIIARSKDMMADVLKGNMLSNQTADEKKRLCDQIVKRLTDESSDKGHDRHIHYQEAMDMGLAIKMLEDPKEKKLQDLVLTVHHCYMYTLSNTGAFKVIESHTGRRWIKLQQQQIHILQKQPAVTPPPAPPPLPASGGPSN